MTNPMLEFYQSNNVSPVRQDVTDLQRHFQRREALFLQLGIAPASIRDRKVLEVGPGSGHNSLYTAALAPKDYLLVEANPKGIEDIRDLFSQHPELQSRIRIENAKLAEFANACTDQFDFVFCENVLGGISEPRLAVEDLAKLVSESGVLMITCMDSISTFPEVVRRFLAYLIIDAEDLLQKKVDQLRPILTPYLNNLKGMSRRHDDWIVDNILLPLSGGYNFFPLPEAVSAISDRFDLYSTAPKFIADWRWYKDICGAGRDFAKNAIEQYWMNAHNLMDYRHVYAPRERKSNEELASLCSRFGANVLKFEADRNRSILAEMQELLGSISAKVRLFSESVAQALEEACAIMPKVREQPSLLQTASKFATLCGRTQQHVTFYRRHV